MTGQDRVSIPGICFIPRPDDGRRCTERQGHGESGVPGEGPVDHYHWPTKTSWPRYEGEHQ